MNEISNFVNGQPFDEDAAVNNPPYSINNFGSEQPLNTKTLPMDTLHGHGKYQVRQRGVGREQAADRLSSWVQ